MTIYIGHLYYDLMNLYGENGNIKSIKYLLESQKIKVIIDNISLNDNIDFNKYDLIVIGCGTYNNLKLSLNHLKKYKKYINEYIESNKFILATGNSIELFGQKINDIEALKIFNYNSKKLDKRIVGDCITTTNLIKTKIIGFQNRESYIDEITNNLFKDKDIGIKYKNFYGTYLLGPILIRNPEFAKYFVNELIKRKNKNYKIKKYDLSLEKKAYNEYFKTYY